MLSKSWILPLGLVATACQGGGGTPASDDTAGSGAIPADNQTMASPDQPDTELLNDGMDWTSKPVDGKPALIYGASQSDGVFSVSCILDDQGDPALQIMRTVAAPKGDKAAMTIRSGTLSGTLETMPPDSDKAPHGYVTAQSAINGPAALALASAAAPIEIQIGEDAPLKVPASPKLRQLIGDCGDTSS